MFIPGMSLGFLARRGIVYPTFVGHGTAICGASPEIGATCEVGDLAIAAAMVYGSVYEASASNGFTYLNHSYDGGGTTLTVFAKVTAGTGESTQITMGGGGNSCFAVMAIYRGVTTFPVNATSDYAGSEGIGYHSVPNAEHSMKVLDVCGGVNTQGYSMNGTPGGDYTADLEVLGTDGVQAWYDICFDSLDIPVGGSTPGAGHSTDNATGSFLVGINLY